MKAIVFNNKIQIQDIDMPIRKDGEALIRVLKAGICNTDLEIIKGYMNFEGVLGHEFVGIVEDASDKKIIGKRIVGEINISCHCCEYCQKGFERHCINREVLGIYKKSGAFAEYITLPEENCHVLPDSISNESAIFIEPLAAAFEILEQIDLKSTHDVLIMGDGKLGQLIAQVINLTDCKLTVLGKHSWKLNRLEEINISICQQIEDKFSYDIVIDATGSVDAFKDALKYVKSKGIIILKTTTNNKLNLNISEIVIREIQIIGSRCGPFHPAIQVLESKKIEVEDLITHEYCLNDSLDAFNSELQKNTFKIALNIP